MDFSWMTPLFDARLRIDDVDIAPVVGGGAAFGRPVRVVADVIRNLSRPRAAQIAVEKIPLHGWHSPAVPPETSTSQPGLNPSVHPSG